MQNIRILKSFCFNASSLVRFRGSFSLQSFVPSFFVHSFFSANAASSTLFPRSVRCGRRHVCVCTSSGIRDTLRPPRWHDVLRASYCYCQVSLEELNEHGRVCICNANFLSSGSIVRLRCGHTRVKQSIFHCAVRTSKMSRKNCVRIFNFVFCLVAMIGTRARAKVCMKLKWIEWGWTMKGCPYAVYKQTIFPLSNLWAPTKRPTKKKNYDDGISLMGNSFPNIVLVLMLWHCEHANVIFRPFIRIEKERVFEYWVDFDSQWTNVRLERQK